MDSTNTANASPRSGWTTFLWSVVIFTIVCLIFVYAAPGGWSWWIPLPEVVSSHGGTVDNLFYITMWIVCITFVLVQGAMIAFLIQYRHRPGRRAVYIHGHHRLEIIWTVTPTIILALLIGYSIKVWADIRLDEPEKPGVVIDVLAQQFQWNFRYPNASLNTRTEHLSPSDPESEFGRTDPKLFRPPSDFFGLDPNDPKGKDDVVTLNEFHFPVDIDVLIFLRSKDVLHSFFLPNFRVKMDAVPGSEGRLYFRAIKPGRYELVCAELCGFQHHTMRARLVVDNTVQEFEAWLKENAPGS